MPAALIATCLNAQLLLSKQCSQLLLIRFTFLITYLCRAASDAFQFEFSGTVEAVGVDVKQWRVGDRVMGVTRFGAYSTQVPDSGPFLFDLCSI